MSRTDLSRMNREIETYLTKVERSVGDYARKERRQILNRAARLVVKAARRRAPVSKKPHYRGKGQDRITYNPGNLRRSIKRLPLRRSPDAIVGPRTRRKKVKEYGGPGQPVDPYYAHMIYGSAEAFRRRVMEPALQASETAALRIIRERSIAAIKKHARRRGIKTAP
jgi:hypothetical protein